MGCGKTTAGTSALQALPGFRGIQRIDCSPAPRIEEVLYSISDFLLQIGIDDLKRVLNQRTPLEGKLSVLFQVLTNHPVVLWLDDLDSVRAGPLADGSDGIAPILESCASLPDSAVGRILITSRERPPTDIHLTRWTLPEFSPADSRLYWKALAATDLYPAVPWPEPGFYPELEASPLGLRLLYAAHVLGGREALDNLSAEPAFFPGAPRGLAEIYSVVVDLMLPPARALLETLAHYGRPLSRGALRHLSVASGKEIRFDGDSTDERLIELERSGLVRAADESDTSAGLYTVHPIVLDAVRTGLHELSDERTETLFVAAANYYLRFASNRDGLWPLFNARECYYKAGRYDEACQVHKCFIEDLLRLGYFDAAREVLTETIETTTGNTRAVTRGNLAIIYKNEAQYDLALELYEQVRNELLALGDRSNVARVLHQIGNVHYLREDLSSALECYQQSSQLSSELGELAIATATRVQIANILYQCGDEDDALGHYREIVGALQHSGSEKNASLIGAVLVQMGQIHQKAKRYLEAETQFKEAEKVVRACDDRRSLIKVLRAHALVARERREYDEALQDYEEATRTAVELGDLVEAATCAILTGDLEKDRVQLGKAISHYSTALKLLTTPPAPRVVTSEQVEAVMELIDERMKELETTMGAESYERARKKHWD
jgi:tetratricopeptide (TPR) repeat protein